MVDLTLRILDTRLNVYRDSLIRFSNILGQLPALPASCVLDLGCGTARCAWAIREHWPDAQIIGLDRDRTQLKQAPDFVMLVRADLRALPVGPGQFGLIIIRHPDIDRMPMGWQSAIQATPQLLCSGGILLVTCYSLAERDQTRRWVSENGAKMALDMRSVEFNRKPLELPDAIGHDRYVAAWQVDQV